LPPQYFGPDGFMETRGYPEVVESNADSHNPQIQQRLWQVSEELTDISFPL